MQLFIFAWMMLLSGLSAVQPVVNLPAKMTVSLDSRFEKQPIVGTIKIIRMKSQAVDEGSFTLDGKPLAVSYQGQERPEWAPNGLDEETVTVSVYTFSMPAQPRGLYLLGSIRARVGSNTVSYPAFSYEVAGSKVSEELSLQAKMAERGPVYPGQKVRFEYQISFRRPIKLTREELPLLDMTGFRSRGAPAINNQAFGEYTVQTITQEAIAETVGTFDSGASLIEGYAYVVDSGGAVRQASELFRAKAPSISVTVLPFPPQNRPVSFGGAVGVFHWQTRLLGSSTVTAGEKLSLEVLVTGSGDLETVDAPDLALQLGIKDSFLLPDIPPVGEEKKGTKRFILELRPLSDKVKEIPAIEFSSFDPISNTYVVKKSAPIPITVRPAATKTVGVSQTKPAEQLMQIQGNVLLADSEIERTELDVALAAWAAGGFFVAILLQFFLRRLLKETKDKKGKSRDMLLEAIKNRGSPDSACQQITKALLTALCEVGYTKQQQHHPQQLKDDGIEGEVKKLLVSIDQKRFTGLEAQMEMNEIITEASALYHRLTHQ